MTPAEAAADWILSAKVEAGAPSSKSSNDSKVGISDFYISVLCLRNSKYLRIEKMFEFALKIYSNSLAVYAGRVSGLLRCLC